MISLDRTREAWKRASDFPGDKEAVYPEHKVAQEFEEHRGKRVLEYGCGGGSDARSYLARGCSVLAVDVVPENVENTRLRSPGVDVLLLLESDRIPEKSATFDVASAHGVIHHIEKPLPVLKEIFRLLKPHGLFYCMLYTEHLQERLAANTRMLMAKHDLSASEAFCWGTDGPGAPYARAYTEDEGKELFLSAGFQVTHEPYVYNHRDFRTWRVVA